LGSSYFTKVILSVVANAGILIITNKHFTKKQFTKRKIMETNTTGSTVISLGADAQAEPQADQVVNGLVNEAPVDNGVKITHEKGEITVDDVYTSQFQKPKSLTAQLRQVITTTFEYPERQISNDMQDSLFEMSEFGFERLKITSHENRIAFIDVPLGSTKESVTSMLKPLTDACIYKVLANEPILTSDQQRGIDAGLTTKDIIANSQAIRYSEGATDRETGEDVGGDLILRNGRIQYRAVFFKKTTTPDIDRRTTEGEVFYTPELSAELFGSINEETQHM